MRKIWTVRRSALKKPRQCGVSVSVGTLQVVGSSHEFSSCEQCMPTRKSLYFLRNPSKEPAILAAKWSLGRSVPDEPFPLPRNAFSSDGPELSRRAVVGRG